MIYANANQSEYYDLLNGAVKKCVDYANGNNLNMYRAGSYTVDGENIFVNVTEYKTACAENRFWEAHKKYIDLHFILIGAEKINIAFIENLQTENYDDENDFLSLQGKPNASVILNENDFLICFPNDAHMTGVFVNEPEKVKKAIFKIKIQ